MLRGQRPGQHITGGQIRMAYLVFTFVALVNIILIFFVDEHKYNRDYLAGIQPEDS